MWNTPEILKQDEAIFRSISREARRQEEHIELIASENYASPAVMAAAGSLLTNKYAEGYPDRRYYGGCAYVDEVEKIAIERARELFGAEHVNVQPHSGSQANMGVYFALLNPGDTVLGMSLNNGGHLTHGSPVNISGKYFHFASYGIDENTERIDYDRVFQQAREIKPKLIVAGASAYSRTIDFAYFRKIAQDVGALLMVDMAHIAGLVAAGEHPSPVPYADVVTSTSHKTMRGPRGGFILCREEFSKAIDKAIFPGIQGGPLMHIIAAKAVCFGEALQSDFKSYQKQVLLNAKMLEEAFRERNIKMVSDGTDNHLLLLDLCDLEMTGKQLETLLGQANITVNKNMVPRDQRKPSETSGIRIGTPAVTTRGFKEKEMIKIADWITEVIRFGEAAVPRVKNEVQNLTDAYPLYQY